MTKKSPVKKSKILYWAIAVVIFYVLTSATVIQGKVEIEKKTGVPGMEPVVVEKLVKTTKYREERTPYGERRCEMFVYNFTKSYTYSETIVNGKRIASCTFFIKNEESVPGTFPMYPQFIKNQNINDGPEITKKIEPFQTARFEWNTTLDVGETLACMLQSADYPSKMKCFYLEPITYAIKQVPYTVEEKKNVTEYVQVDSTTVKQNITRNIYTNKFFGYRQFLYFGY